MKKVEIHCTIKDESNDELDVIFDVKNIGDQPIALNDFIACLTKLKEIYIRSIIANSKDVHIEINKTNLKKLN